MSVRVVGYEGEGRTRRPIRVDEGPASAGYADQVGPGKASLMASGIPDRELTGGAGEVERRFITQAERAVRAEVRPSPIAPRTATHSPKEPAMTIEPPQAIIESTDGHAEALGRLAKAASDAAIAHEAKRQADAVWQAAQAALADAWSEVKGTDVPASLNGAGEITIRGRGNTPAQSRANGTAAMLAKRAPKAPPAEKAYKRTPEQRARMRQAQLAASERRKAANGG